MLSGENCGRLTSEAAREGCARLRSLLHDLRVRRLTLDLPSFVSLALEEGPFFYHLFGEGADDRLVEAVTETLVSVVDSLVERSESNLAAFIEALDVAIKGKALGEGRGSTFPAGRVRVITIHSAKGPAVSGGRDPRDQAASTRIPIGFHLCKRAGLFLSKKEEWGRGYTDSDTYESEKADGEQEELCLLYVAMTRARDHLFLSSPYPNGVQEGEKENFFGTVLDVLRENPILHEEIRDVSGIEFTSLGGKEPPGDDATREAIASSLLDEWSLERERLDAARTRRAPARGIQFATWRHLHAFSQCPLMYYYRYVTRIAALAEMGDEAGAVAAEEAEEFSGEPRLHRGVDPKTYGSFVHRLLFEWMVPAAPARARPEDLVDDVADRFGFSPAQVKAVRKPVLETLTDFAGSDLANKENVYRLEEPAQIRVDRLLFRGTIDRIDRVDGAYRVIDYKGKMPRDEYPYQVRFYAWLMRKAGLPVSDGSSLLSHAADLGAIASTCRRRGSTRSSATLFDWKRRRPRGGSIRRRAERAGSARSAGCAGTPCEQRSFSGYCPCAAARSAE